MESYTAKPPVPQQFQNTVRFPETVLYHFRIQTKNIIKVYFDAIFCMLPNEKDCPSYTPIISVESKAIDEGRKGLLVNAKVRCIVICAEYSNSYSKPSTVVLLAIKYVRRKDSIMKISSHCSQQ